MKKENSVPTKEEIRKYILELQESAGNPIRIEAALEKQDMLVAYLAEIGVSESWLTRAAIVEITKQKMASILLKSKNINVSERGIEYGKSEMSVKNGVFYIYNTGSENEYIKFEEAELKEDLSKSDDERFVKAQRNDEFIAFSEENEAGKIEKIIDKNGIVRIERSFINDIWGLLPKETYVRGRTFQKTAVTKLTQIEDEVIVNRSEAGDYGAVTTARPVANINVLDMLSKYPTYKEWFESRGFDIDTIVEAIEEEHSENLKTVQSRYEESKRLGEFGKDFNKNEKTLGEFYDYLAKLSPLAQKAFMKSLAIKRGKNDKVTDIIAKKIELAMKGNLEVQQHDLELAKIESMEDLNEQARQRAKAKNERLGRKDRTEEQDKLDLFVAREEILQENWNTQIRLAGYHYRVFEQSTEINAIKGGIKGIPFIGKNFAKQLKKEDIER